MKNHIKLKRRAIVFLCSLLFSTLLSYSFMQAHVEPALGAISATLLGTDGNDVLSVPGGDSNLTNYTIFGLGGNDTLTGGGGNDKLFGSLGDDKLFGGLGKDQLFGDLGDDQLFGGNDNDKLYGNLGDDFLDGGNNDDLLNGSLGNDVLFGNKGNDNLSGGQGNDTVVGGNDQDTIVGFGGGSENEIDNLIGGGNVALDDQGSANVDISGDGAKDVFVLGDDRSAYYAQAGDDDYAVIFGFETDVDQIVLSGTANYAFGVSDGNTLIFANLPTGQQDLIAVVVGVVDLTSNNFSLN